jgi:hypothetical protein
MTYSLYIADPLHVIHQQYLMMGLQSSDAYLPFYAVVVILAPRISAMKGNGPIKSVGSFWSNLLLAVPGRQLEDTWMVRLCSGRHMTRQTRSDWRLYLPSLSWLLTSARRSALCALAPL